MDTIVENLAFEENLPIETESGKIIKSIEDIIIINGQRIDNQQHDNVIIDLNNKKNLLADLLDVPKDELYRWERYEPDTIFLTRFKGRNISELSIGNSPFSPKILYITDPETDNISLQSITADSNYIKVNTVPFIKRFNLKDESLYPLTEETRGRRELNRLHKEYPFLDGIESQSFLDLLKLSPGSLLFTVMNPYDYKEHLHLVYGPGSDKDNSKLLELKARLFRQKFLAYPPNQIKSIDADYLVGIAKQKVLNLPHTLEYTELFRNLIYPRHSGIGGNYLGITIEMNRFYY